MCISFCASSHCLHVLIACGARTLQRLELKYTTVGGISSKYLDFLRFLAIFGEKKNC